MGLSTLSEALEVVEEYGERLNEAELLRLKGKLLQDHQPGEAEEHFRRAITVARRQKALAWEQWAAVSLGHLLAERGEKLQADELMSEIYDRFSEGFETIDLRNIRSFLDQASDSPLPLPPS